MDAQFTVYPPPAVPVDMAKAVRNMASGVAADPGVVLHAFRAAVATPDVMVDLAGLVSVCLVGTVAPLALRPCGAGIAGMAVDTGLSTLQEVVSSASGVSHRERASIQAAVEILGNALGGLRIASALTGKGVHRALARARAGLIVADRLSDELADSPIKSSIKATIALAEKASDMIDAGAGKPTRGSQKRPQKAASPSRKMPSRPKARTKMPEREERAPQDRTRSEGQLERDGERRLDEPDPPPQTLM